MSLTVSEFLQDVRGAASAGSSHNYAPYWDRIEHGFTIDGEPVHALGHLQLTAVRASQIQRGARLAAETAVKRRNSREGSYAATHYIAAARQLWELAIKDGLTGSNPASLVAKPKKQESPRHALNPQQLSQMWVAAAETGNDPALDVLLLRFHLETGARREGALNLTHQDVHQARQTLILREKGGKDREQPISGTLMRSLLEHYQARRPAGDTSTQILRYRSGEPLTRRRYNSLFERIQRHVPWAGELGVSAHWLRHTAITQVERVSSYSVAQRFAGHATVEVTGTYSKATITEVAKAVSKLTGEPHPLAPTSTTTPHPW